ncbi:DNA-processing protein DprA [Ideonella oryzae]|uniref:DNA-processing protein DprA n=1 Tax=Ideonella oryzae TaxID=2937441 RepID=A0ABT1BNI9_9BURK|nr:DNA-processing protein DprA [Ideonella oryzae]MCO5977156.1 DNA-processing protein DprA [Ideonella oryzae]
MAADERLDWLLLTQTPGLGREAQRRLLAAFGSPAAVLRADARRWTEVAGPAAAQALGAPPEDRLALAERTLRWLEEAPALRHLLPLGHPDYPDLLLNAADPPVLLYGQGQLHWLRTPCAAIVGSRHASPQGLDLAHDFARALAQTGVTVVSGLALGIDGAAHEGALDGGGGTVAVVGTGLDRVYPARHRSLAHRIQDQGLLLSEFPLGAPPRPEHFPSRNRIIAGMSLGTLVVEAAPKSGSLITARLAGECGREVWAIPGSVLSPQSRGCHQLIREGAALVEEPQEVIDALRALHGGTALPPPASPAPVVPTAVHDDTQAPPSDAQEDPLLQAMGHDPITLDTLAARSGWPVDQLLARLLTLELEGRVARMPGGLLQRRGRG